MFRIATACLFCYWMAIFVATHIPAASLPKVDVSDKTAHVVAYAGLAFLMCWAIPTGSYVLRWTVIGCLGLAYACLDEFTQNFIPGRTYDNFDILADVIGVGLGILLFTVFSLCVRLVVAKRKSTASAQLALHEKS